MGKKSPKRRKPAAPAVAPSRGSLPECPYCGGTAQEQDPSSGLDGIYRSHAELCTALRLVGRQILRYQKQDEQNVEKIRRVLERADHIRKSLRIPEPAETPDEMERVLAAAAEFNAALADVPRPAGSKRNSRRSRLNAPVLRFPKR